VNTAAPDSHLVLTAPGTTFVSPPVPLDRERVDQYVAACLQRAPAIVGGRVLPPTISFLPSLRAIFAAASTFMSRDLIDSVLHLGHHETILRRPRVGSVLVAEAQVAGAYRIFSGVAVVFDVKVVDDTGGTVSLQRSTIAVTGARSFEGTRLARRDLTFETPALDADQRLSAISLPVDLGVTYRAVSGDGLRVHLDAEAARLAGLEGVTLQGICGAAVAIGAAYDTYQDLADLRLKAFAVEFSSAIYLDRDLLVKLARGRTADGERVEFEAWIRDGRRCLRRGSLQFADDE
jgi:hypothetical protein